MARYVSPMVLYSTYLTKSVVIAIEPVPIIQTIQVCQCLKVSSILQLLLCFFQASSKQYCLYWSTYKWLGLCLQCFWTLSPDKECCYQYCDSSFLTNYPGHYVIRSRVRALIYWLWEMTQLWEALCSNPSTLYWTDMTFFMLICCENCIVCVKRLKINKKETGDGPFIKVIRSGQWLWLNW